MLSMKLLLAFTVMIGIFADKCDLGNLDIGEVADNVVVTNVGSVGEALVMVDFNHNQVSWHVPAGTSKTASGLAATKYTVGVLVPSSSTWLTYPERLQRARDDLVALSRDPTAPADKVLDAAAQLPLIVEALHQVEANRVVQSCSASLKSGVDGRVTVAYTRAADGTGFWVLDCS